MSEKNRTGQGVCNRHATDAGRIRKMLDCKSLRFQYALESAENQLIASHAGQIDTQSKRLLNHWPIKVHAVFQVKRIFPAPSRLRKYSMARSSPQASSESPDGDASYRRSGASMTLRLSRRSGRRRESGRRFRRRVGRRQGGCVRRARLGLGGGLAQQVAPAAVIVGVDARLASAQQQGGPQNHQ